jgi:hypothetical protein
VQKRLMAAKQAVVPSPGPCWNHSQREYPQIRKRQHAIGRIIARMKAQGRSTLDDSDFRQLQTATGHDRRWTACTVEALMQQAKREHKAFRPYQPPQPAARLARLAEFAEYAYWLELARLLAERRAA